MGISGWIGVDLDGTLAEYGTWKGADHIGKPIPLMVERVKKWLSEGVKVKIMTARYDNGAEQILLIQAWCKEHLGQELEVTNKKDYGMIELWDDRAITVETNTGRVLTK